MKIRVLHVVPDLVPYGLEKMVASLGLLRDQRRFDVSVVSLYAASAGSMGDALSRQGIGVFHLDKKKGFDPRMFYRLARVLKQVRPDVLHTHNYVLRYTLPAGMGSHVPVKVHTIHNVADRETDRLGVWLQRLAFRGPVSPVAIAEEVAASYQRVYELPRPALIPNGVAVEDYRDNPEARDRLRRQWNCSADDVVFICLARFFPQKNHKTLLEAFAAGPGRLANAHLVLAGDGVLMDAAREQAATLGIADRVRFLGRRDDVPALLNAADAFALASLWEGNPLAVMEAMAAGLPVAVTAVGGVPELVEDGKSGLLAPPGDSRALAAAMLKIATDGGLRANLGRTARRRARERFDHRVMVHAYEDLYQTLLGNRWNGGAQGAAA